MSLTSTSSVRLRANVKKTLFGCCLTAVSTSIFAEPPTKVQNVDAFLEGDERVLVTWEQARDNDSVRGYNVYKNGRYHYTTRSTKFLDRDVEAGNEYTYSIVAFDYDRNFAKKSEASRIVIRDDNSSSNGVQGFGAPTRLSGREVAAGTVIWEWNEVSDAEEYEVVVDGRVAGTTENLSFESEDLWRGNHSLTVKAINRNGDRSEQSDTLKIYVEDRPVDGGSTTVALNDDSGSSDSDDVDSSSSIPANIDEDDDGLIDPQSRYINDAQKDGYDLVFSDEFNGSSVNPSRWATNLRWDSDFNGERYEYRVINEEAQFYVSPLTSDDEHREKLRDHSPFKFDGSKLTIQTKVNPFYEDSGDRAYGRFDRILKQQPFMSGVLSTHTTFARKYGHFEARIRIPGEVGAFPAFWLYAKDRSGAGGKRTEIDIMESLGHAPWYVYNSMHYYRDASDNYSGSYQFIKPSPSGQIYTGTDFSDNFHVYSVRWEPGYVAWMIDGAVVSEVWDDAADIEPMHMILNLAVGGRWVNYPENAGGLGRDPWERFPTDNDIDNFERPALEIDYVRVYERD